MNEHMRQDTKVAEDDAAHADDWQKAIDEFTTKQGLRSLAQSPSFVSFFRFLVCVSACACAFVCLCAHACVCRRPQISNCSIVDMPRLQNSTDMAKLEEEEKQKRKEMEEKLNKMEEVFGFMLCVVMH